MYQSIVKPLLDRVLALLLLLLTAPLLLLISIILALATKSNPLFLQRRPGQNEKLFILLKFKSMNNKTDASGHLLPDELRLTKIGKLLRLTSLDELPQLCNVLIGNMSLVGPRPLMEEYLQYYTPVQKLRHAVKPGITGWAQVNGRNQLSWNHKFELDNWYVKNISFKTDLYILWLTFLKICNAKGVSAPGHATMPKFSDEVKYKRTI